MTQAPPPDPGDEKEVGLEWPLTKPELPELSSHLDILQVRRVRASLSWDLQAAP